MSLCTPSRNAICLASDQNYIDYTYVTVLSIAEHASPAQYYEVVILSSGVLEYKKKIFYRLNSENFIVRFIDMEEYVESTGMKDFSINSYLSIATYFRYFIPKIFSDSNKVLYLDGDIIATTDISDIFNTNMNGKLLGTVHDAGIYSFSERLKEYFSDVLNMDWQDYFNAGVLLYNIYECKEFGLMDKCFQTQHNIKTPYFNDQDILNTITIRKNHKLPLRWNFMYMIYATDKLSHLKEARPDFYQDYITEGNSAILIHYAGPRKAWHHPQLPFADLWWEVARKTPFYERFLSEVTQYQISTVVNRDALRVTVLSSKRNSIKLRHTAYRLLSKITSGSLRKKLMNKRQKLKAQLDLLKNWEK